MKICIVLSTQRSGSTFLVDYLSSAPGVKVHSELFQRLAPELVGSANRPRHYDLAFQTYRKASVVRRLAHRWRRNWLIESYLDEIYAPKPGIDVIGMKLMYDQARRYPEVLSWLRRRDVLYVHLIRENLLDLIVSRELAVKRGTYSMLRPLASVKVHLDVDTLISDLERISSEIEHFRRYCSELPSHELTYEALAADTAGEAQRILGLLGSAAQKPAGSKLRKTNLAARQDVIDNYDEVVSAISAHPGLRRFVA